MHAPSEQTFCFVFQLTSARGYNCRERFLIAVRSNLVQSQAAENSVGVNVSAQNASNHCKESVCVWRLVCSASNKNGHSEHRTNRQ